MIRKADARVLLSEFLHMAETINLKYPKQKFYEVQRLTKELETAKRELEEAQAHYEQMIDVALANSGVVSIDRKCDLCDKPALYSLSYDGLLIEKSLCRKHLDDALMQVYPRTR